MPRKVKNRFVQPVSSFQSTERKDLGQAVDDKNVLKNVTEVTEKKKGGGLPTYKEAWDMDLEGIKGMYASYDDYVADMEGIKPGSERDKEREAARAEAEKDVDVKSYELDDVKKPGKLPGLNPPDLGNKSFLTLGSLASSVSFIACSTILVSIGRSCGSVPPF